MPEAVKKRRHMEVVEAFRAEALKLNKSRIGEKHLVLVEGNSKKSDEALVGRNDAFVKVVFPKVREQVHPDNELSCFCVSLCVFFASL